MTYHILPSFKLLEISILSAQDLAPVSKLLRTYAVAWVDPDQKMTTRVDHHGHTNPTWNCRFIFRVDDTFLNSDTSTITFEIYNVSWLRDIPIGTVQTGINNLVPPSVRSPKNPFTRYVSFQLCRPTGALQGRINLSVNLIDGTRRSLPLDSELSATITDDIPKISQNTKLCRSESEGSMSRTLGGVTDSKHGSIFSTVSILDRLRRQKSAKAMAAPTSICSPKMKPLPSEVVATMARGFNSATDDNGSCVLENWTVPGDDDDSHQEDVKQNVITKFEVVTHQKHNKFTPVSKPKPLQLQQKKKTMKKHKRAGSGGLLSCFGLSCGFECLCGQQKGKIKRRTGIEDSKMPTNHSQEKFRKIYR